MTTAAETGPRLTAVLSEARDWIADCAWQDDADALAALTDQQVIHGINRHYAGGWDAFVINAKPIWTAIPLG